MMTTRNMIAGAVALILLAGAGWYLFGRDTTNATGYNIETSEAETADIRRSVSASGSVRARVTVEVGSQLSGQLAEIMVDYNSPVEAGQIIARIDPQSFETRVRESEAALATAEAQISLQRAGLQRVDANLLVAEEDFARVESLHERGIASDAALQAAVAQLASARSERSVALAQITNARAALQQREATLEGARIDLERTIIRAPIDGVVIDRVVDVGQTVAASMSAPTLFTIAQDLSVVQIDAQVDESDIGQVRQGQSASFNVDAFPGQSYDGVVDQVRLAATNTANIVTYTVVITADNPGGRLLPGMTANLDIVTGERSGVLSVPNGALRFRPSGELEDRIIAAPEREGARGQRGGRTGPGGRGGGRGGPGRGIAQMAEQLGMTDDQQEQAQTAMRQIFSQMRAQAEAGGRPDRSAMQSQIAQALSGILTTEQMTQYRQMQAEAAESRPATIYVLAEDGGFQERNVRIGVADSQRTEILGGQLEAGEPVITRARLAE